MKRSSIITTNYETVKSTFAHGEDSEKTQRSLKSAATAVIEFESNHSQTVTNNVYILNIYINMKYRHIIKPKQQQQQQQQKNRRKAHKHT